MLQAADVYTREVVTQHLTIFYIPDFYGIQSASLFNFTPQTVSQESGKTELSTDAFQLWMAQQNKIKNKSHC